MKTINISVLILGLMVALASCTKKPCPCEEEVVALNQQQTETSAQLAASMSSMDSVMNSFEQIDVLKEEYRTAKANNDTLRASEITKLINQKFEASDKRISELDGKLAKSNKKISSLRKVVANLRVQLEESRQSLAVLEGKVAELSGTVDAQNQVIARKESEIGESKGENTALNITLRDTQRKAFLEKGQAYIEAGKQAQSAGNALSGFVNGKKKKAQYLLAKDQYQKAIDHLTNIPGGLGGFSDDNNERKEFDDKMAEAKKLQEEVVEKLK